MTCKPRQAAGERKAHFQKASSSAISKTKLENIGLENYFHEHFTANIMNNAVLLRNRLLDV